RRATGKIRLMAWLALGDSCRRRRRSGGRALHRPALCREIGRNLSEIFLRKLLCYRRHYRVVAVTASIILPLLDQITLLLTPDDRNGFRIGGHAVRTVARGARLRFCLDVVSGMRR